MDKPKDWYDIVRKIYKESDQYLFDNDYGKISDMMDRWIDAPLLYKIAILVITNKRKNHIKSRPDFYTTCYNEAVEEHGEESANNLLNGLQ